MPRGRRANNEGSVYRDAANGSWVARIPIKDPLGNTKQKKKHFETQREANEWRKHQIKERDRATASQQDMTLEVFAAYVHENTWAKRALANKTLQSYRLHLRLYILGPNSYNRFAEQCSLEETNATAPGYSYLGERTLKELNAPQIEAWAKQFSSTSGVEHAWRLLSIILNLAVKPYRHIPYNPMDGLDAPLHKPARSTTLSIDEVRQLTSADIPDRIKGIISAAILLGLRKGEILGARWSDLDLANRAWRVAQQVTDEGEFKLPKGEKVRIVPIPPSLCEWLAEWRRTCGPTTNATNALVFSSETGATIPLAHSNVSRSFAAALKKAKLPHMRFHDLRHTHAAIMHAAGADSKTRQDVLGHASSAITDDVYTEAYQSVLARHLAAAESLIIGK